MSSLSKHLAVDATRIPYFRCKDIPNTLNSTNKISTFFGNGHTILTYRTNTFEIRGIFKKLNISKIAMCLIRQKTEFYPPEKNCKSLNRKMENVLHKNKKFLILKTINVI